MRRKARIGSLLFALMITGLLGACSRQAPDTRADEAAIRAADIAWSNAAAAKDLERGVSYYASDGSMLAPNAPPATGTDAIHRAWTQLFALPGFSVRWQPSKVEVSRAGDLGYSEGSYELTMNDAKGKPVTDRGKYVAVWKKQAGGAWKVAADIFNSNLPAAAPAAK